MGMAIEKRMNSVMFFVDFFFCLKWTLYGLSICAFIFRKLSVLKLVTGRSSATIDPTRVTQISWRPRFSVIFLVYLFV